MIKKILPISIFVLVLVLVILLGLQNLLNKNKVQTNTLLTPTLYEGKQGSNSNYGSNQNGGSQNSNSTNTSDKAALTESAFKSKLPISKTDFTVDHSDKLGKYVVTLKTDNGQSAYNDWLDQNVSYGEFLPVEQVIIAHQSVDELDNALDYAEKNKLSPDEEFKKNTEVLLNVFNVLFSPISTPKKAITVPTPTPTPKPQTNSNNNSNNSEDHSGSSSYTYYAQCGGAYDSYLLPIQNGTDGKKCTECSAGCGPTTAAMILSSYVDSTLNPPKVIESMSKAGVAISCNGSGMYDLYNYMSNASGIKVSTLISLGHVEAKEVVDDFRNYIKGGWTLFVLADCKYGGHYFWVTDVSSDGKILAYDPAYGSGRPTPLDENQYDPHPYYVYAFPVKKN